MFNLHLPLFSFQLFIMFFVLLMPLCSAAPHLLPLPSIQCTFCTFIHSTSSLNVPLSVLCVYILYSYNIVWSVEWGGGESCKFSALDVSRIYKLSENLSLFLNENLMFYVFNIHSTPTFWHSLLHFEWICHCVFRRCVREQVLHGGFFKWKFFIILLGMGIFLDF